MIVMRKGWGNVIREQRSMQKRLPFLEGTQWRYEDLQGQDHVNNILLDASLKTEERNLARSHDALLTKNAIKDLVKSPQWNPVSSCTYGNIVPFPRGNRDKPISLFKTHSICILPSVSKFSRRVSHHGIFRIGIKQLIYPKWSRGIEKKSCGDIA